MVDVGSEGESYRQCRHHAAGWFPTPALPTNWPWPVGTEYACLFCVVCYPLPTNEGPIENRRVFGFVLRGMTTLNGWD